MFREPEKVVRVVEEDEFAKLLEVCRNPAFRVLLIVAYRQGLRRQELVNLRWSAVDLAQRDLHVVNVSESGEFTKSRKNRSMPMHPDVHAELTAMWAQTPKRLEGGAIRPASLYVFTWPDGTQLRADWVTHEFARLVKVAGVAHCRPHDLRRSFSSIAQRKGVEKYTVKDLGGWSVVRVVEAHDTGEVKEAYRRAMGRIARTA